MFCTTRYRTAREFGQTRSLLFVPCAYFLPSFLPPFPYSRHRNGNLSGEPNSLRDSREKAPLAFSVGEGVATGVDTAQCPLIATFSMSGSVSLKSGTSPVLNRLRICACDIILTSIRTSFRSAGVRFPSDKMKRAAAGGGASMSKTHVHTHRAPTMTFFSGELYIPHPITDV